MGVGEAVRAMTKPEKPKESKKSEPLKPEVVILERVEPEVEKSQEEGIEAEPNKPEQNRTVNGRAIRGILLALIMAVTGLATWRVAAPQGENRRDEVAEQAQGSEPEMTEEEKAAEEERQRQAELAEQERKRQAELAEQERQRQEALAREKEQRAQQMAQAATNGRPLVALTFDDGPSGVTTPQLLDILKAKGVKATFFVLGGPLNSRPDICQRAEAEGHEVESHTMTHRNLEKATLGEIQWEVASMNQLFQEKLGHLPNLTRPPYGNGIRRAEVTQNIGTPMIYWSVDTEDWRSRNAAAVQARVRQDTYDGAIILMHDIYQSTVDAVPGIIDELRARGYEFVTVEELARARGVTMANGVTYFNFRP